MPKQRTAYSYIRFSTPDQLQGNSLARQSEKAQAIAEKNGWTLDTTLNIRDLGKSAFKGGKQVGLAAFLRAIEDGQVAPGSVLIVERLDRLSRGEIKTALKLFLSIIEAGVDIQTTDPEQLHTNESTNDIAGLLVPLVGFATAHDESAKKSERTFDNWTRKRRRAEKGEAMTTKKPSWLDIADGKFVVNQAKAKIIRQLYQWAADGMGARLIVARLNTSGIRNIAFGTSKSCKETWTQNYVELLLTSRQLIGEYQAYCFKSGTRQPIGEPITGYYPPVVTEQLFYKVQAARKQRTSLKIRGRVGTGVPNLFTGLLFDARDKATMQLMNSSQAEKKAGCFRRLCSYRASTRVTPDLYSWQYERFERAFLQFMPDIDLSLKPKTAKPSQMQELTDQLATINHKIAAVKKRVSGASQIDTLLDLLTGLDAERQDILDRIEHAKESEASSQADATVAMQEIISQLDDATGDKKDDMRLKVKSLLPSIVSEIWTLIDNYRVGGKIVRVCTVQVFMGGDKPAFQYHLVRVGYTFYVAKSVIKHNLKAYNGKPILSGVTLDTFLGESLVVGPLVHDPNKVHAHNRKADKPHGKAKRA